MQRAKALGAKFVEANFKNVTQLEWAYTGVSENGHQAFHVFNGVSGGFLIVSACDLTSPILGYSEQGSFDPNRVPSGLQYFLDGYGQSVDLAEEMLDKADFVIAREWDNLELQGLSFMELQRRMPRATHSSLTDTMPTDSSILTGVGAACLTAISASIISTPITTIGPWLRRWLPMLALWRCITAPHKLQPISPSNLSPTSRIAVPYIGITQPKR